MVASFNLKPTADVNLNPLEKVRCLCQKKKKGMHCVHVGSALRAVDLFVCAHSLTHSYVPDDIEHYTVHYPQKSCIEPPLW